MLNQVSLNILKRLALIIGMGVSSIVFAQSPLSEVKAAVPNERGVKIPDIQPFGSELFVGEFAKQSFSGFNPNYVINIGDQIDFQMWGGFEANETLTVDAQGNVFIPKVGPVKVAGVENARLNALLLERIKRIFKSNVSTYAALKTAQPVKIYVTGYVNKPGLYAGLSSDSILYYIDSAKGINPDTGSYIDIQVKRLNKVIHRVNLYDFLLDGTIAPMQLMDGDIILIGERKQTVITRGELERPARVEFDKALLAKDLLALVKPTAKASHLRVTHLSGDSYQSEYLKVSELGDYALSDGDQVDIVADKRFGTISVRIEGEHEGLREMILPYGASLDQVVSDIEFSDLSNEGGIQLFRRSIKARQKDMIESSLNSLEETVLTARSQTLDGAKLRAVEAEQVLKWIQKARQIEPKGQVVLGDKASFKNIALEDGDVIKIPKDSGLVMVHGEVMFPSALSYDEKLSIFDYIKLTGGYSRRTGVSKVLILHPNGQFTEVSIRKAKKMKLSPNDEVIVLPKVDVKTMQIVKDISRVIYEIALSARAFVGI